MRTVLATLLVLAACAGPGPDSAPAARSVHTGRGDAPLTTAPADAGALSFRAQEGWVAEAPASAMRVAQYRVPGGADLADASLVVYHFGDAAGDVEENVRRWASQFEGSVALERREYTVGGLAVHEAAVSGTFVAETAPGSDERRNEPGWRLLAAIVESDHGPYYVKLVGPDATVRANEGAFRRFLEDIRVGP